MWSRQSFERWGSAIAPQIDISGAIQARPFELILFHTAPQPLKYVAITVLHTGLETPVVRGIPLFVLGLCSLNIGRVVRNMHGMLVKQDGECKSNTFKFLILTSLFVTVSSCTFNIYFIYIQNNFTVSILFF